MHKSHSVQVSVIIPNFNRKEELKRAIDSVLNQTLQDFELIVVDDFSVFSNKEYLIEQGYLQDKRIQVFRNEKNMGISFTRNAGISRASGKYIAFLDSDDYWEPEKLQEQILLFKEQPDLDLVYCNTYLVKNGIQEPRKTPLEREDLWHKLLDCWTPPNPSTVMIKKESIERVGGFDVDLRHHEDLDFWFRMAQASFRFDFSSKYLSNFSYDSSDRLSNTYKLKFERTKVFLKKWQAEICQKEGNKKYEIFKSNMNTRIAIEVFINSLKFKKLANVVDVYFRFLILKKEFYQLLLAKMK